MLAPSKYHQWQERYGRPNQHNGKTPRDGWLAEWGKQVFLTYHGRFPRKGYRRLALMMLDANKAVVSSVSPARVYRVLQGAGRLDRKWPRSTKNGRGLVQPLTAHDHWRVDVTYLNLGGTFCYHCSLFTGYNRMIVHWEIRESMTECDVETIVQRALEKYPAAKLRIISDIGPQFMAKDFKEFVRLFDITHVRTSPYYPQSNGKLERWHGSLNREKLRPACPGTAEAARQLVAEFVRHYSEERLRSALGYLTSADMLAGRGPRYSPSAIASWRPLGGCGWRRSGRCWARMPVMCQNLSQRNTEKG